MKTRAPYAVIVAAILCLALTVHAHAASGLDLARQLNQALADVAEKVSPSVVVITVTTKPGTEAAEPLDLSEADEGTTPRQFWKKFHENLEENLVGQGSGVIIRPNGYIVTNRHVVEDAETIEVRLLDGRSFKGTIRGVDAQSDVAVIKIEATGLPIAKFASSAKTRVGEFAIAIGTPYNLDYSVTIGHVSAKGRSNVVPSYLGTALLDQDFIQTDANINPGNSGGPLVNIDGEIIGINTLIRGLHTGIGFAIPSDLAREVSEGLITSGKFTRAWLGVSIQGLKENPALRERFKTIEDGVLVGKIVSDGPAASSDLRVGDVIVKVENQRVATTQELRNQVRGKKVGQSVNLEIVRDNKTMRVSIKPGEYPEPKPVIVAKKKSRSLLPADLGIEVQWLTTDTAKKFGVDAKDGVVISEVLPDSPAAKRGFKPGDVVVSVNHERTFSPAQFREALAGGSLKTGVILEFTRGKEQLTETLKAGAE